MDYAGGKVENYYYKPQASVNKIVEQTAHDINENHAKKFNGIYRVDFLGGKEEVYCPRCGSENCSYYQEQKIIPGKTKTKYTMNLNPLKPFTLVNKKEKVVRKEEIITETKIVCNDCGKIFS